MVDRLVSQAPAELRFNILKSVADLAQYEDELLPEGSRAMVLEPDSGGGAPNGSGMREFIYTRRDIPASPSVSFTLGNGALGTATRNAYRAKSGALWVQWPQQYLIQLNAATPVAVAGVITVVGGAAFTNIRILWRRLTAAAANGQPIFTVTDNALSVVSQANDSGQILASVYAGFLYT